MTWFAINILIITLIYFFSTTSSWFCSGLSSSTHRCRHIYGTPKRWIIQRSCPHVTAKPVRPEASWLCLEFLPCQEVLPHWFSTFTAGWMHILQRWDYLYCLPWWLMTLYSWDLMLASWSAWLKKYIMKNWTLKTKETQWTMLASQFQRIIWVHQAHPKSTHWFHNQLHSPWRCLYQTSTCQVDHAAPSFQGRSNLWWMQLQLQLPINHRKVKLCRSNHTVT